MAIRKYTGALGPVLKCLYGGNLQIFIISSGKPLQPSLMFVERPRVDHLKGASLGYAPDLSSNIRLGWRGLQGTNTLAYYENP